MSVPAVPLMGGRGEAVGVALMPVGMLMGVVGLGEEVLGAQMKEEEVVVGTERVEVLEA